MNPTVPNHPLAERLANAPFVLIKEEEVQVLVALVNVLATLKDIRVACGIMEHVTDRLRSESYVHVAQDNWDKYEVLKTLADDVQKLYLTPKA